MAQKYCNCRSHRKLKTNSAFFPSLFSVLVVLLPKCPFCIAGYSAAITVCGSKSLASNDIHWLPWLSLGLMCLVLTLILFNYKGIRSVVAAGFVLLGMALVGYCEWLNGAMLYYNLGSLALLLGVWVNGNFAFVYKKLVQAFTTFKKPVAHH